MTTAASRWMCLVVVAVAVLAGCDDSSSKASRPTSTGTAQARTRSDAPVYDRVTFRGSLALDGAPLDSEFLGAVVRREGLVTPCQVSLPAVKGGKYEITLYADTESKGCGARGGEVLLWTFANDKTLYSSKGVAWPESAHLRDFDASFATATPTGDVPPMAQFNGDAFAKNGKRLPPGAVVEAYVGTTRCGIASTRRSTDYSGFILAVVGPEAVPGCTRDAKLAFRVNGQPANGNAVNTPTARGADVNVRIR